MRIWTAIAVGMFVIGGLWFALWAYLMVQGADWGAGGVAAAVVLGFAPATLACLCWLLGAVCLRMASSSVRTQYSQQWRRSTASAAEIAQALEDSQPAAREFDRMAEQEQAARAAAANRLWKR